MENAVIKSNNCELAVNSNIFTEYLAQLNLPTDNIIASTEQRNIVAQNIPSFVETLSPEAKSNARYLSKFVGASAIGLFDAALNYIWNEVVLALRFKAETYGIDLFFDAAIGGDKRAFYKNKDDLSNLKDAQLIDTCYKLELIPPITCKKIKHILDMRNEVAASHPNIEDIGGYELLGWLDTCVSEIIKDSRSESAIHVKVFIDSLKNYQGIIDEITIKRLLDEIKHLSTPHIHNLVFTLFNWYTTSDDNDLRINIAKIIPSIWDAATDIVKYKIGQRVDTFRTQLRPEKEKAEEFLTMVGGRRYETVPAKLIIFDQLADRLRWAHNGLNNFHTEPVIMREILQFCSSANDIPEAIAKKLIKVVLICRLGRGYVRYNEGISSTGRPLYDSFLGMLDDRYINIALQCLLSDGIKENLNSLQCQTHGKNILKIFAENSISGRQKEIINFIADNINKFDKILDDATFKALISLEWSNNWLKESNIIQ